MTPRYYALACDELPERKAALEAHLRERGVRATVVRGVHGETWGLETRLEYEPGRRLTPGHVALNLGSWMMWAYAHYDAARTDCDPLAPVVFLEDDVELPEDWGAELHRVAAELAAVNENWDLVFLGLAEAEPGVWHKVTERLGGPTSRVCRLDDPFGTHALMVRPRAIPLMLDAMREARRNLDQQLFHNLLRPGKLNWCAVLPTLVRQRTFDYTGAGRPQWAASCIPAAVAAPPPPEPPPEAGLAETLALVDPYPCVYRGEPLFEHGRLTTAKKSVPCYECALLREPCHARASLEIVAHPAGAGGVATACRTCRPRRDMSPAPRRRPRLPLPEGHFNPSIALYRGRLILATRDSWGHSKVGLWDLTNAAADWAGEWAAAPISSLASNHPDAPRLEDPRLFVMHDRLLCAFNLPDNYPPKRVRVGYCLFSEDLKRIEATDVLDSPPGNAYEKNWEPFVDSGRLRWVYGAKPEHVILDADGRELARTPNPLPWTGGAVRGGCPPVLMTNVNCMIGGEERSRSTEYYAFFHGCLKRTFGSVYTVGCYTFEAGPPYRITRMTPTPLVWPDLPADGEDVVKRHVVFPGGAVPHAGHWHLALGIDDCHCRVARLPFADVEAALAAVPEADPAAVESIRNTPIALGVRPQ